MTTTGKQARRRRTIKRQIVHGILEDGMGGRKTINCMIARLVGREAGIGELETIGGMIVRLVWRET